MLLSLLVNFSYANNNDMYDSLEVGLLYNINTNRNSFHNYWNQNWSFETFFSTPFYRGQLQTGIILNSFRSHNIQFVDFKTIYLYFGWGINLKFPFQVHCTPSINIGNVMMFFERPSNRPNIPKYIYDLEEELAVRLNFGFSYPISGNLFYRLSFSYKVIYINKKIELNLLSTGISYSFDMPEWLKVFLK